MNRDKLVEIAEYFMNDNTCISCNYKDIDLYTCDEEELISAIKSEFQYLLGICGCGNPEIVFENIYNLLFLIKNKSMWNDDLTRKESKEYEEYQKKYDEFLHIEGNKETDWKSLTILYMLDDKGFTEHGTSVYGCWITDLGEWYLLIFEDKKFNPASMDRLWE